MDWTAPASGSGTVQFDLAVLSANGNGRTSGDSYGTYSTSLLEDVPSNVAPTVADVFGRTDEPVHRRRPVGHLHLQRRRR